MGLEPITFLLPWTVNKICAFQYMMKYLIIYIWLCIYCHTWNAHIFQTVGNRTNIIGSRPMFWGSTISLRLRKMLHYLRFKSYGLKAKMCITVVNKAEIPYFEKSIIFLTKRENYWLGSKPMFWGPRNSLRVKIFYHQ